MDAPPIVAGWAPAGGREARLALFGDERLARLVGSGNERAFTTLYDRYHQPLYRYCRSIVLDDDDARDALQSTLTSAFVALRRGRRDAPLRPWLFRIAHNEAISLIRRRANTSELTETPESSALSAADRADERARLALLVADLRELPDRQRGALLMRELSGLSHEEIAVALGTSVGTAKQAILEARRALLDFEEGRSMACEDVRRTVSDNDGRALRGRRVRAHLRECTACAAFATAIPARREDLQALAPVLAPTASAAMLARVAGAGSGHGAAGAVPLATGTAGKAVGATLAAKTLVGAAILVTAAASVTGMHTVLMRHSHGARRAPDAHTAETTVPGAAGHAALPASRAPASRTGGRGGHGPQATTAGRASGGAGTGSSAARSGLGAGGASPAQAHGTPARGVRGERRAGSGARTGRHAAGPPSSPPARSHTGATNRSRTAGGAGSRAASDGGSGSASKSTRAASEPSSLGSAVSSPADAPAASGASSPSAPPARPATGTR
jgi:RNA polymerase sigma factor (sigma-70 family)